MKHNLIDLLNGFYDLDIQNQLDPASSFLFITLLRKFNSTKNKQNGDYFPESLPIFNNELNHLTGMELRTLRNARTRLIAFRLLPDDETTWLLKYESKGTKESGVYAINYHLLESFDLGKFGNKNFLNEDDLGKSGNDIFPNNEENGIIKENLVTKSVFQNEIEENNVTQNADLPPENDPISAKNVLLSRTKQNKTKQSSSYSTSKVLSTNQSPEKNPIDSSLNNSEPKINTDPLWQGRDASGRWHPPAELAKEGDNGKKPPKPPDEKSNFEFIASQQRDVQTRLLNRLTGEKKAEFYEWIKSQKGDTE